MLQTKRYIGNDLARLYRRVRNELGEDALIFSTRTLHRADGPPLIEMQAAPPASDDTLPLELQQAMLSTVLSRVAPGMKVPELEDLVLRGVLGPSVANDVTYGHFEPIPEPPVTEPEPEPVAFVAPAPPPSNLEEELVAAGLWPWVAERIALRRPDAGAESAVANYLSHLPVAYPDEFETAIVVIDGPAGGGRTTAMLRMALDCSEAGRSAVIVAADMTHAGAVDRLAGYADAMGLDFVEADDDRRLEKAVRKAKRGTVFFIDAQPGWLPPPFVTAPVYRYAAVPGHWQSQALEEWSEGVAHATFAGAIPTFTDLATDLTPAISTVVSLGTGIAFLSSGSDISSGIEVADARAIASGIFSMRTGGRTDGRLVASA